MERIDPGPLLLVEDTPALVSVYESVLRRSGLDVRTVTSLAAARAELAARRYRIVLLDLMLPDGSGLGLLGDLRAAGGGCRVVVITANGSINLAVEAMRAGAADFLVKPFDDRRLLAAVHGAIDQLAAASAPDPALEPASAAPELPGTAEPEAPPGFIGSSPAMRALYATLRNVGRSNATVFLTGESGTGKELAAQAVHAHSARSQGPFVPINCGAIPADLLESEVFGHLRGSFTGAISDKKGAAAAADGGTLFLDEICEMPLALQTKLLRFLQTSTIQPVGATQAHRVDVRIVCATNRDPLADVRAGRFREDLYYRLHVVPIALPPLRARGDDVVEIASRLLLDYATEEGRAFRRLAPAAAELIRRHRWPGNVRELQNVLRNVVVLNDGAELTPDMLPQELRGGAPASPAAPCGKDPGTVPAPSLRTFVGMSLSELEEAFIAETLASCGGSVPKAARLLGVSPSTLYRRREAAGGE